MKHLHIGVGPKNLRDVMMALPLPEGQYTKVHIDGDGWEAWGEDIGTDANDDETIHVIVPCVAEEADLVVAKVKGYLVPMKAEHQKGIVACLTDVDDWSTLDGGVVKNYR